MYFTDSFVSDIWLMILRILASCIFDNWMKLQKEIRLHVYIDHS